MFRARTQRSGRDGAVVGKREAEFTVRNGIEPVGIADGERAVELILRAQGGDGFRGDLRIQAHLVEIISRRESGK